MSLTPSDPRISLRPISLLGTDGSSGDLPFLRNLYASTRREEVAMSGWPHAQAEAFLTQQFEIQHANYMENYAGADFDLILFNGEHTGSEIENRKSRIENLEIGRLYLDERDSEFRIIDIALLPEWRGKGIGGGLMRDILDLARTRRKDVRIHVETNNPAIKLYERLGFTELESNGIYNLMEWTASEPVTV